MPVDYELGNDDKANAQTFNILFGDINARLKTLENSSSAINQASDELVEVGLAKINPAVDAALAALDNVSELSNLFEAHSKSEVEIVAGLTEFIIEPDDRPHFVAPKFLVLYVPGQLDNWVAGQTQSWNKETGQLLIDITNVSGTGVHSDWTVAPVAMMPDAGPTIDAYTKSEVDSAIAQAKADSKTETKNELLGGAGPAHDTLQELAAELADDENAIAGLTNLVSQKADLSELTGNTIPLGAVIFLCVDVCPPGFLPAKGQSFDPLVYPEFFGAYGKTTMPNIANRVIRGDGVLAGNVDDYQEDEIGSHRHISPIALNDDGVSQPPFGDAGTVSQLGITNGMMEPANAAESGDKMPYTQFEGDTETRVKSWIGYPIVKVSSAYVNQGTTDLSALETAINSAVRNDIPQVFADGGAQVRANIGADVNLGELHLQHQKPSGTGGGTRYGSTNVWAIYPFNTIIANTIVGVSMLNSVITLPVGTYKVLETRVRGVNMLEARLKITHNTSAGSALVGETAYANGADGSSVALLSGEFTVTSAGELQIDYRPKGTTGNTSDLGRPASSGDVEIYGNCVIRKVA